MIKFKDGKLTYAGNDKRVAKVVARINKRGGVLVSQSIKSKSGIREKWEVVKITAKNLNIIYYELPVAVKIEAV